jgi:hypothetical protein
MLLLLQYIICQRILVAGQGYEFVQFELLGDQMNLVIGGSDSWNC